MEDDFFFLKCTAEKIFIIIISCTSPTKRPKSIVFVALSSSAEEKLRKNLDLESLRVLFVFFLYCSLPTRTLLEVHCAVLLMSLD